MRVFLNYEACSAFTEATGIEALPLKEYKRLDKPVSAHADMLINIIEENIFCYEDYYTENREVFDIAEKCGYRIIRCKPPASANYPHDIGLNALVLGKRIIGRIDYIAKELRDLAEERGYELISTRQGYTACSTLALNEENIITADISVKNAAERVGINVTLIDEKSIALPGYNYGFIGGASFVYNGKIYFFGDAGRLSEYGKICSAADRLNMSVISISSGDVVDFGGARIIL